MYDCGYGWLLLRSSVQVLPQILIYSSRLTEAGLLSIPSIKARQESAIMSLVALESHSSMSSCSWVCFTSTAPITFIDQLDKEKRSSVQVNLLSL